MGLDVAVWWDRNESEWKVFDDSCAHGLAPLSEGMIDQWGQLQCVCTMGSVSMALVTANSFLRLPQMVLR